MRRIAEELSFCGVDVWLDEWELQAGESLYDVLADAATRARFLGVIVGGSFSDSPWANDELKIGLSREKSEKRSLVIPVVIGRQALPPFLQDRIYVDLRRKRYEGLARLLGILFKLPRQRVEEAVQATHPESLAGLHRYLRYCGVSPKLALNKEDVALILAAGGRKTTDGCVEFLPEEVLRHSSTPPHLAKLMTRIQEALRGGM